MKKLLCLLVTYCFAGCSPLIALKPGEKAIVIVPVADGLERRVVTTEQPEALKRYDNIPYTGEYPQTYACERLHQLLFNEWVIIKKVTDTEAKVALTSAVEYKHKQACAQPLEVWTQKNNLMEEKEAISSFDARLIPGNYAPNRTGIVSLKYPWTDPETGLCYSAGTRFVQQESSDCTDAHVAVALPDYKQGSLKTRYVPRTLVMVNDHHTTDKHKRDRFVALLRSWARLERGIIPYVWGGASFSHILQTDLFSLKDVLYHNERHLAWVRPGMHPQPLSGCDCSSVILRASQIASLPYFFKNSNAMSMGLKPLQADELLQDGDFFWYPGHVLIVSNVSKNLIIEAAGYGIGYGRLHEAPLNAIFRDINTYAELVNAYKLRKPITRLKKDGTFRYDINQYALLTLNSIF